MTDDCEEVTLSFCRSAAPSQSWMSPFAPDSLNAAWTWGLSASTSLMPSSSCDDTALPAGPPRKTTLPPASPSWSTTHWAHVLPLNWGDQSV